MQLSQNVKRAPVKMVIISLKKLEIHLGRLETADSKAVFSFEFECGRLSKIQMKTNHQIDDQLKVHVRMHCKIFISCMIQRKLMKGRYCHGIMRNY